MVLWEAQLAGPGLGGIAATERYVVFGDRDLQDFHDVFRCLDARTGQPVWKVEQLAIGKLDYGNMPRATPWIDGERVFLIGAFGDVHCVELATGKVLWKRNLRKDFEFKGELPWGYCGSPLVVDDKLILQPGGPQASLVALDAETGKLVWKSAGNPPSYGSLIVGQFGGRQQIVGHDATTLGGWDPATGKRLWTLKPSIEGDFNVPTPIAIAGKLLVTTENNGARLYQFDEQGVIVKQPAGEYRKLAPDMSSPVVVGERLFCVNRFLYCLDLSSGLKEVWRARNPALDDYGAIICDDARLLIAGKGELLLVDATADQFRLAARTKIFDEADEIYAHPALVGERLYVRGETSLKCIALPNSK
jgi:outer membrane protein assembly factor BamB